MGFLLDELLLVKSDLLELAMLTDVKKNLLF